MKELFIMFIFGLVLLILGILLKKRDARLYENSVVTTAKVVSYYTYRGSNNYGFMYTAEVEYTLEDGSAMHTKEQSGSNRKKYTIGTELNIYYSKEKPELFIVSGDNSRKYIFYGMILVGLVLMIICGATILNRGF